MRHPWWLSIVGILWGVLLSGCTSQPASGTQVVTIQMPTEPVTLDPSYLEDGMALRVLANTMRGLMVLNRDRKLELALAENMEVLDEGRTYRFTLRSGARWSDGVPVTPEQFVYAFRRMLAPTSPSKFAGFYEWIRKAREYRQGKATEQELGVKVVDGKLVFELERALPYFPQLLTISQSYPLRPEIVQKNQGHWPIVAPGTGPYFIESYQNQQRLVMKKNAHYFGKVEDSAPVEVDWWVVQDESTGMRLFEQGKLDVVTRVSAYDLKRAHDQGAVFSFPMAATFYLAFNQKTPPFDRKENRQLVQKVVDRVTLTELLGTGDIPAKGWVPPGIEGFIRANPEDLRVHRSNKSTRPKWPEISLGYDSSARNAMLMERVQQELKQELSVKSRLVTKDWKSFLSSLTTEPPNIYRLAWVAPFNDPITHLEVFTSKSPNQYTGWNNPEYDRLVEEIRWMHPGPGRTEKIEKAQKILIEDDVVMIPIFHYAQTYLVSKRIKNFNPYASTVIPFEQVEISAPSKQ